MKRIKLTSFMTVIIIASVVFMTLSANAKTVYKITYDYGVAESSDSAITNDNPSEYDADSIYTLLDASCDGYEFKGWFFDSEYTEPAETLGGDITGDITLYAMWYESVYSVSYVLTDGNTNITEDEIYNLNAVSRNAGESVYLYDLTSQNPNYVFAGWYSDSECTNAISSIPANTYSDVTVYAKWKNAVYSITYDLGDAEDDEYSDTNPNPLEYEYSVELIPVDPSTDNPALTFDGWYFDEEFTLKADSISSGTQGDITLYAKWTRLTYAITYVLSDDSGINAETIVNNNPAYQDGTSDIILTDPESEDKNFEFVGWYTTADFNEESKITTIYASVDYEIILYAKWQTAVYTITYDMSIIDTSIYPVENNNPDTYLFGDATELLSLDADGFIFNGWTLEQDSTSYITSLPEDIYGDITLYADFTEKTYTIQYYLASNGLTESEVVNDNLSVRTTTESVELNDPETINLFYTFGGWYFDSAFTLPAEEIDAYTTSNVSVYAKWVKIVTYLPVWGDATLSDQLTVADARLALRYAAKLETFDSLQLKVADLNNDGSVTIADARLILRVSASLESIDDIKETYSLGEITVVDGEIVIIDEETTE